MTSQSELEVLVADFEEFGLNGYQARVLLALLRLGSAPAARVARLSGVPRTSVYPVLEELRVRELVQLVPGKAAVWVSLGEKEVLRRLLVVQEEHFRSLERRMEEARHRLAALATIDTSVNLPQLRIFHTTAQVSGAFLDLLADATDEVLFLARPLWSTGLGNARVLDMLGRGVAMRALWPVDTVARPGCELVRDELQSYIDAGAQGGLVDEVPVELVIVDRRWVVFALTQDVDTAAGDPPALLVDHAGYAGLQADAFAARWEQAQTWEAVIPPARNRRAPEAGEAAGKDLATGSVARP
ncbi:MAG: TrmB family transcriptional regulator [Acidimicrobiales bacterium]